MKKIIKIGLSGSQVNMMWGTSGTYKNNYINEFYVNSIKAAGAAPLILPICTEDEFIESQLEAIDGLILTGGADINPLIWGEEPITALGDVMPDRDTFEIKLFKKAKELNIPILAICRGIQLVNVAEGGNLYQDLSQIPGSYIKHNQGGSLSLGSHTIEVTEDTTLYKVLNTKEITVNSFHHQAVKDIAEGYIVSAMAKDGIIEAIESEHMEAHFVLAVQWHPEMMSSTNEAMANLFTTLVQEGIKRNK